MDSLCLLAIHFFEQEELPMLCILPHRGTEYCENLTARPNFGGHYIPKKLYFFTAFLSHLYFFLITYYVLTWSTIMELHVLPAVKTGKKPQILRSLETKTPYWVEMIYDLVHGAGFSYSRIAYRIKVSPSTIQKLATHWDRKPRHLVFHRLLALYQKVFRSTHTSTQLRLYWENKK